MAAATLTEEDDLAQWEEYRRTRDLGLRNRLVLDNLGLVHQVARSYAGTQGEALDDLVQEGCLGLIAAAERFRPERGVQFSSYAYPVILGFVKNYFRARRRLLGWGRKAKERGDAGDAGRSGEQLLSTEDIETTLRTAHSDFSGSVVSRLLTEALLSRLPQMERRIIVHLFWDELTQTETARTVGRSDSSVSRLLRQALQRFRELLVEVQREESCLQAASSPALVLAASVVDPRTGLFAREHFLRNLAAEMKRARAFGAPLCAALLRPVPVAAPVGDALLKEMAAEVHRRVRVLDYVYRAGPEELGMIFSLPRAQVAAICDRLYGEQPAVDMVWGIVAYPEDGDTARELLAAAREAVRRAMKAAPA